MPLRLDRWMQAEGVGLDGLNGSTIERYLAGRRAAGYRQYGSLKEMQTAAGLPRPVGSAAGPAAAAA